MRVVVALGGNALLKRGEPMTAERQRDERAHRRRRRWRRSRADHELVLSHGNGPQVGLLALQAAAYTEVEPYPLDVLGAQTQGMIGYVLEQELRQPAAARRAVRDHPDDGRGRPGRPGVRRPHQVRRPGLRPRQQADQLADEKGWVVQAGRGVAGGASCPRPSPQRIFEIRPIRGLLDHDVGRHLRRRRRRPDDVRPGRRRARPSIGVEAVIDKDLASRAARPRGGRRPVRAWPPTSTASTPTGAPREQRRLDRVTPQELRGDRVPGRVDGAEGRGGGALRGGDREARRHRRPRPTSRQIVDGTAGTQVVAALSQPHQTEGGEAWQRSESTQRSGGCAR